MHENSFCAGKACAAAAVDSAPPPNCNCSTGADTPSSERCSGGLAVGVPGTVAAVARLVDSYGSWPLSKLVAPAVKLARDGFPMYEDLFVLISKSSELLARFDATRQVFLRPVGAGVYAPIVGVGQGFTQPDLARSLEALAAPGGIDDFYNGTVAAEIVAAARAALTHSTGKRGLLEQSDLASYRAVRRAAVGTQVPTTGGAILQVHGAAPPLSGGATLALALNLLEARRASTLSACSSDQGEAACAAASLDVQNAAFADRSA